MTKRIVIPATDEAGLNSCVARHFGRAPYFVVVELNEKCKVQKVKTKVNSGEHMGGTGHPHENLLTLEPDVIAAYGMGPRGLQGFRNANVKVLKAEGNTVQEVINSFKQGKLRELTGGCEHAHHHSN